VSIYIFCSILGNPRVLHREEIYSSGVTENDTAVSKANQNVGLIFKSFSCMNKDIFLTLYKSLVRPYLETAINYASKHMSLFGHIISI